ncbi:hypothetical protein [uncultured Hoeflea sp.]|uniref:hypothetical protein n=1 Tax=uncultured Hoeflea sp. TaxID=538666 RepID=UPI00261678B6|nr:hypothetical protein [uncultured Hoeflea sp.]
MTRSGKLAFWVALLCAALFSADVVAGAFFRAAFLSDVAQALVLALSCSFFVAGLLFIERQNKAGETSNINGEENTQ